MSRYKVSVVRTSLEAVHTHKLFDTGKKIYYRDHPPGGRNYGWSQKKDTFLPDPEDFIEGETYSPNDLDLFADAWLRRDTRRHFEDPVILFEEHLHERRKREIYVETGFPDETLTNILSSDGQALYWRTHPMGRRVNSAESRSKHGASYYR